MAEAVLLSDDRGRVRVLTLNRPEKLNALNGALSAALLEALAGADAAPEIGAIVLTGAGRAFCAGADRAELAAAEDESALVARTERTVRLQTILPQLSKPVVGA